MWSCLSYPLQAILWALTLGYLPKQWRNPFLLCRLLFCPLRYLTWGLFLVLSCPFIACLEKSCPECYCIEYEIWEKNWTKLDSCSSCAVCDVTWCKCQAEESILRSDSDGEYQSYGALLV